MPAADTGSADWVVAGIRGFAESVLSLVPAGFPAYLRVFHSAYRRDMTPVRWAEIAAANGTRAHPGMQLISITGSLRFEHDPQTGVYDYEPEVGSLPSEVAEPLARVLARHTTTPERCWFAVWHGFGALPAEVRSAPTFTLPSREYHLLAGPLGAITESGRSFHFGSRPIYGGPTTAPGASPPRSISIRPTSVAATTAATTCWGEPSSRSTRSIPRPGSTGTAIP